VIVWNNVPPMSFSTIRSDPAFDRVVYGTSKMRSICRAGATEQSVGEQSERPNACGSNNG
jgi:hypothetical protein